MSVKIDLWAPYWKARHQPAVLSHDFILKSLQSVKLVGYLKLGYLKATLLKKTIHKIYSTFYIIKITEKYLATVITIASNILFSILAFQCYSSNYFNLEATCWASANLLFRPSSYQCCLFSGLKNGTLLRRVLLREKKIKF